MSAGRGGTAITLLVVVLASCATRQTGPPSYVGPADPESLECARTVLEPRGWDVSRLEGSVPGLEAERRDRGIRFVDVIRVRIQSGESGRELEAVPRSYALRRSRRPNDQEPTRSEVDPPDDVTRLAALTVATCQVDEGEPSGS